MGSPSLVLCQAVAVHILSRRALSQNFKIRCTDALVMSCLCCSLWLESFYYQDSEHSAGHSLSLCMELCGTVSFTLMYSYQSVWLLCGKKCWDKRVSLSNCAEWRHWERPKETKNVFPPNQGQIIELLSHVKRCSLPFSPAQEHNIHHLLYA